MDTPTNISPIRKTHPAATNNTRKELAEALRALATAIEAETGPDILTALLITDDGQGLHWVPYGDDDPFKVIGLLQVVLELEKGNLV